MEITPMPPGVPDFHENPPPARVPPGSPAGKTAFAGFWFRFAAYAIDMLCIYFLMLLLMLPILSFAGLQVFDAGKGTGLLLALINGVMLVYFPFFESSRWQATPGKRAMGLRVTDMNGQRIGLARAYGRMAAKFLSAIPLHAGFVMAAFTERRQALHDLLAGTLVIRAYHP